MQHTLDATEDKLIESLSFQLPSSSNYIIDRKSTSFFPANGNEFSPNGVKILRFMITGTDWFDPATLRIQYKFNNSDNANALYPINALAVNPFRRLRILCGGQLVEDIDYYNLTYTMLHYLMPAERRLNDAVEGFGLSKDVSDINLTSLNFSPLIPPGGSRVVSFPLLCGLMLQPKKLPLMFLQGLQIELEVVNQYEDCVLKQTVLPEGVAAETVGTNPATSTTWSISEAVVHCDIITLDSAVNNTYVSHLAQGKTLPIPISSYVHQVQNTGDNADFFISLSRSFTRLETVYCTFYKPPYVWHKQADAPDGSGAAITTALATHIPLREQNYFWHPQHVYNYGESFGTTYKQPVVANEPFNTQQGWVFQYRTEPEIQLQIGSKLFPEIPVRSSAEAYYHLKKSLGCEKPNSSYSLNISEREYRTTKFIVAFDIRKEHSAFATGMNTRTGDLITLKCKKFQHVDNLNHTWNNTTPQFVHVTLQYSSMMVISDSGISVLD